MDRDRLTGDVHNFLTRQYIQYLQRANQTRHYEQAVRNTVDVRAPGKYAWLQRVFPAYIARNLMNPFFFHVSNVVRAPRELIKYLIELLLYLPTEMRRQWGLPPRRR